MDKKIITALVLLGLFITFSVGVLVNESVVNEEKITITTGQPPIHSIKVIDYSDGTSNLIRGVVE